MIPMLGQLRNLLMNKTCLITATSLRIQSDVQRSFLIFQRDLNVIVLNHKERIEALKRTNSQEQNDFGVAGSFAILSSYDNDPFWNDESVFRIFDELVARVQNVKKQNAMNDVTAKFENPQVESQDAATVKEVLVEDVDTNPQECLTREVEKEQTHAVFDDHYPEDHNEEKTTKKNKKRSRPSFNLRILGSSSSSSTDSDSDLPPPIVVQSIESDTDNQARSDPVNCEEVNKSVNKDDEEEEVPIHQDQSKDVGKTVNEVVQSENICGIEVYEQVRIHYKLQKNDEVSNICYIDPMRLDDCDWPSGNPTLKSSFMKKNSRYLKGYSRIEKDVADFCFHHHRTPNLSNVFKIELYSWKYYLNFQGIKTLIDSVFLDSNVVDTWSIILNKSMKYQCSSTSTVTRVYYFNTQHSSYVEKLVIGKDHELNEETAYSLRSSWHFSMKQMVQLNDLKSVSFFMIPVCFEQHFVAVAVNFDQSKIQYLDNVLDNCMENSRNWKVVQILIEQFSIFLKDMEHPRASEVELFPVEEVALAWKSPVMNIDCGVFVMHHMEHFRGDLYMKEDLVVEIERRKLRVRYCSRIILSDINECRDEIMEEILRFAKRTR